MLTSCFTSGKGNSVHPPCLLIFGHGYTGAAIARAAQAEGWQVAATARCPATAVATAIPLLPFLDLETEAEIARATHIVSTVPPNGDGDPVLQTYGGALAKAPKLIWAGYLSTIGVYGDRAGAWVDETTPPAPSSERSLLRRRIEIAWEECLTTHLSLDIFRVAGIYGPGRSAFDTLRAGNARRIIKPGHLFSRIHRDDIAASVLRAAMQPRPPGSRILNLADDEPASSAAVLEEAARLLGVPAPDAIAYTDALPGMSAMARSFWAENRLVSSRRTQQALGLSWRHPSYREGLRAILREETETSFVLSGGGGEPG